MVVNRGSEDKELEVGVRHYRRKRKYTRNEVRGLQLKLIETRGTIELRMRDFRSRYFKTVCRLKRNRR